ncbi:protein of unknown function [Pseudoxanthobacter soli DSM 19599]|uniref:DUF3825 domain-containing protein n=1 Tax=Pseudoxanthobacter soli DSM 19599 TaxID=1123029 RepID=A0A1M7ZFG0_9HYPH|nr:DUF3825 domain-containing protein [Pseudoxanthobacter soli]SHO63572.1 protein of unknown function [Pseudoxanthobacter soli DSM 19599]
MRIFDFARVADWDDRLATLAELAEPERWNNRHLSSKNNYPILDRYVANTFIRAYDQQKIVLADHIACFNTGLLTPGQEEIFGVFTISETYDRSRPAGQENKKWWLKTWARSGDRVLTDFMEFPALVEYWSEPKDLIFDPKLQVQLNLDHIIRDNLKRFPEELGGQVGKDGRPVEEEPEDGSEAEAEAANDKQIPVATRNALEGAVKQSIRLAKRSYRIAVPQFYRNKIQLLLPIYLRDSNEPDLALTLERHGGWYRAATVLYMDWAYSHARLLARPNSEWLGGFKSGSQDA